MDTVKNTIAEKYNFFSVPYRIKELIKQYETHGQLIIAVDFDETLFDCYNHGHDFTPIYDVLKRARKLGCKTVIFTARNEGSFHEIEAHCKEVGVEYDTINKDIITLDFGWSRKIYYNVFLDDKAGLMEAFLILKGAIMWLEKQRDGIE